MRDCAYAQSRLSFHCSSAISMAVDEDATKKKILATDDFCHLQITFANGLDPDRRS